MTNRGKGAATAFSVLLSDAGPFTFSGLGVGASETRTFDCLDRVREATVDYSNEVAEEDVEDNHRNVYALVALCSDSAARACSRPSRAPVTARRRP